VAAEETVAALRSLKQPGRRLVLVTGRELPDPQRVFSQLDLFDIAVVENEALLVEPATRHKPRSPTRHVPLLSRNFAVAGFARCRSAAASSRPGSPTKRLSSMPFVISGSSCRLSLTRGSDGAPRPASTRRAVSLQRLRSTMMRSGSSINREMTPSSPQPPSGRVNPAKSAAKIPQPGCSPNRVPTSRLPFQLAALLASCPEPPPRRHHKRQCSPSPLSTRFCLTGPDS
jgi:hypothetical protein